MSVDHFSARFGKHKMIHYFFMWTVCNFFFIIELPKVCPCIIWWEIEWLCTSYATCFVHVSLVFFPCHFKGNSNFRSWRVKKKLSLVFFYPSRKLLKLLFPLNSRDSEVLLKGNGMFSERQQSQIGLVKSKVK